MDTNEMLDEKEIEETEEKEFKKHKEKKDGNSKKKKIVKIKAIAIAVVLLTVVITVVVGIFALIKSLNYMKPVNDIAKIYNGRVTNPENAYMLIHTGDDEKLYKKTCKILESSEYYGEYYSDMKDNLEQHYRDIAAVNGAGVKMKFDVTGKKEKMDEGDKAVIYNAINEHVEEYAQIAEKLSALTKDDYASIADMIGISKSKAKTLCEIVYQYAKNHSTVTLQKGYKVTGRFVITDKDGKTIEKTDKITLSIIYLNGEWCIYDGANEGIYMATGNEELSDVNMIMNLYYEFMN